MASMMFSLSAKRTCLRRVVAAVACALLVGAPGALAHSPTLDACTCDWCYFDVAGADDTSARLSCTPKVVTVPYPTCTCVAGATPGEEVVWYDDEGDNLVVNDMANLATTSDATTLYFAAGLYNDPDPSSIPSGQVAIDLRPGGNSTWLDVEGTCSMSGFNCTGNPGVCGGGGDVCVVGKLNNPNIGLNSTPVIEAEYLIVFDFALFVLGGGITVGPYGQLMEATTNPGEWTLIRSLDVAVDPGLLGTTGGPPGKVEVEVDWADFACDAGCPSFGPKDRFRVSFMIAEGDTALPFFTPGGPIEDTITEEVGGTHTTTNDDCAIGGGTTTCELGDTSGDAFIIAGSQFGQILLTLSKPGSGMLELAWDPSHYRSAIDPGCSETDDEYEVYQGTVGGSFTSHTPVTCGTGGSTTHSMSTPGGNVYFLVVPANTGTDREGSYGTDSAGAERAVGGGACRTQDLVGCP